MTLSRWQLKWQKTTTPTDNDDDDTDNDNEADNNTNADNHNDANNHNNTSYNIRIKKSNIVSVQKALILFILKI